ncbi:hypothetical protein ALO94_201127 [Pseudomonas syringae pv. spinaceae]|uniref:D,D-heptose 1,7-bisphosphate phosphatase n=1 Tax=Pseudomonas syringae pv. spinaceae TaxID=264459 RepID=A0A0Q0ALA0_PSESX|nr:hypothetical protein ALO94_201127 [Pseudomonas syringae pv. spinaceae]
MLAAALDITRANVGVVALQRSHQVVQRQLVGREFFRVGGYLVLLGETADGVDLGHTRHVAQLRLDNPVLDHSQVRRRVRRAVFFQRAVVGFDRPQKNLAEAGGNRPHHGIDAFGQLVLGNLQALAHQLARKEQVCAVFENHRDLGQARARQRAGLLQARQAGHVGFDGEGNPLLGLQR